MKALQRLAYEWGARAFGSHHISNPKVRALRLVEEAIELAQAEGVPETQVLRCLAVVYGRPVGDPIREAGGVALTLAIYCEGKGWDVKGVLVAEIGRVLSKGPEHFAKRNQEKLDLGLTGEEP